MTITILNISMTSSQYAYSQSNQSNTAVSGNNLDNNTTVKKPINTTGIDITLNDDANNNMFSTALTALAGAGGALGGSYLTYRIATKTSKAEKQKEEKYNLSLRVIVSDEFKEYYDLLKLFVESLHFGRKIDGRELYEMTFAAQDHFLKALKKYERPSIIALVPLERKAQTFLPKTLVKIESVYEEFHTFIPQLFERIENYLPGFHENTISIEIDKARVERLVDNIRDTRLAIK